MVRDYALLAGLLVSTACASVPPAEATTPIAVNGTATRLAGTRYLQYRVGIQIAARPEVVWSLLTDAPAYPSWNSTVVKIDGAIARDADIELVSKIDPERTFELNVSVLEPTRRMVWQDGGAMFKGVRTFVLTPSADGGTDFTMAEIFTGMMMGMIEDDLPDFRPSFQAFAADLKRAAEARGNSG